MDALAIDIVSLFLIEEEEDEVEEDFSEDDEPD